MVPFNVGAPPVAPVLAAPAIVTIEPEAPVKVKLDPVPVVIRPLFQVNPFRVTVALLPVVKVPPTNWGLTKVATALFSVVIIELPSIFRPTVPEP